MMATGSHSHRFGRRSGAVGLAILCSAATAAGAGAAGLKITVPAHLKKGASYTIEVVGHYRRAELQGQAYLISLIQFSSARCQPTAQLENQRVGNLVQFYLAPPRAPHKVGVVETSPRFTRLDSFTANRVGRRHVCAYLYPKLIAAGDSTAPIATADRVYKVTRR
jgi:hypothetical protein